MSGKVLYLCFFSELSGFLFPYELPEKHYSPGVFLVSQDANLNYFYNYTFDAMDNGRRVSLNLTRVNEANPESTLYVVKTKSYGSFWFDLKKINNLFRYVGNNTELSEHGDFSIAISTDINKLERVCANFDFFFIGNTLRRTD